MTDPTVRLSWPYDADDDRLEADAMFGAVLFAGVVACGLVLGAGVVWVVGRCLR